MLFLPVNGYFELKFCNEKQWLEIRLERRKGQENSCCPTLQVDLHTPGPAGDPCQTWIKTRLITKHTAAGYIPLIGNGGT